MGRTGSHAGIVFIQSEIFPVSAEPGGSQIDCGLIQQETPEKPFVIKGLTAEGCFQRSLFINIFSLV